MGLPGWCNPVVHLLVDITGLVIFVLTGQRAIERLLRTRLHPTHLGDDEQHLEQHALEARIRTLLGEEHKAGTHAGKRFERLLYGSTDAREMGTSIVEAESIKPDRAGFQVVLKRLFATCESIASANSALAQALQISGTAFEPTNAMHVAMLAETWRELRPNAPLPDNGQATIGHYKGPEWGALGFQGTDPATDFRGMGLLGLQQLLHYAQAYPGPARSSLDRLNLPTVGYPLAIVSIAMSDWVLGLLKARRLDGQFSCGTPWPAFEKESAKKRRQSRAGHNEATPLLAGGGGDSDAIDSRPAAANVGAGMRGSTASGHDGTAGGGVDSETLVSSSLPALHALHASLLLVFDCVWWDDGRVERWVPSSAAGLLDTASALGDGGWTMVGGHRAGPPSFQGPAGAIGPNGVPRRGVIFALATTAYARVGPAGAAASTSNAASYYQASNGQLKTSKSDKGPAFGTTAHAGPLTVMDFPRVFKAYKLAVEALLVEDNGV